MREQENSLSNKPILYYIILCTVFGASLAAAAAQGSKIISVFGLAGSGTLLAFSLTFLVTDVVSEIYGKKAANFLVWGGFWAVIFTFTLYGIGIIWPAAPFWKNQEAFKSIFGVSLRIIAAGIISYIVSQKHDVWAYHFWLKKTSGKHMYLRNNLSTLTSQLINTAIFVPIAFYGIQPIIPIFIGHYVGKILIALVDTPFIYLVVYLLRKKFGLNKNEIITFSGKKSTHEEIEASIEGTN